MTATRRYSAGAFLVLLSVIFCDATMDLWPAIGVQSDVCARIQTMPDFDKPDYVEAVRKAYKISCKTANTPITRVNVEGMRMALSPDQALFSVVALFAAIGGALQSLRVLFLHPSSDVAGTRSFAWALIRPFAAMPLALVVYVTVRAFFLPAGNLATTNPYGFLALAAAIGLFADRLLTPFLRKTTAN